MAMVHRRSLSVCKVLECFVNKKNHLYFGTMILDNQLNIDLGWTKKMERMFTLPLFICTEKASILVQALRHLGKICISLVASTTSQYSQEPQLLQNGVKLSVIE